MIPNYTISYSFRKSIGLRINRSGQLLVSAPYGVSEHKVHNFVQSKEQRIHKTLQKIQNNPPDPKIMLTPQMKDQALIQLLPRIEYYADRMGLAQRYTSLKITNATTKRGSCSSRGGLMFHRKLTQFPLPIVDYVIVHELAHLVHFNHSDQFWSLVEEHYPEYRHAKTRLKKNGQGKAIG